jgi:RNA polymerase sigma factor (sigma-70 family)
MPDDDLMKLVQAGDSNAIEPLMKRHGSSLLGYCVRMYGSDRASAEDAYQEVWLKVLRYSKSYTCQGIFRSWLMTIARNTILTSIKKRIPASSFTTEEGDEREIADEFNLELTLTNAESVARMKNALDGLIDVQRITLMLWLEEGATYEKIAADLGVSEGVVRANLHRAKKVLRRRLGGI